MAKLTVNDIDLIIALYTTPKEDGTYLQQSDIAPRFGVSDATAGRVLNRAGISGIGRRGSNRRKLSPQDIEQIARMYTTRDDDGLYRSANVIGAEFGVTNGCVLYHLRAHGVSVRTTGETQAGRAYHPNTNVPPDGEVPPLCACGCSRPVEWGQNHRQWNKYVDGHYRPRKPYHDKDWLDREYTVKGRAITDIAAESGVTVNAIIKSLDKHGIEHRPMGESLHLSGATRGEKNAAWKGGVAQWSYAFDWKSIAKSVRKRDHWTCRLCGESFRGRLHQLHVHHINEDKTDNSEQNLVSLCAACHRSAHSDKAVAEKLRS